MITTVDACMAQQPQRRDIINIYMSHGHDHLMSVLSYYWEKQATRISAFDTLTMLDWSFNYLKELKMFGI